MTRVPLHEAVRSLPSEVLVGLVWPLNGHALYEPAVLEHRGLPHAVARALTRTHRCDGSLKGQLFAGGRPVRSVRGVCGLELLTLIADALGVSAPPGLGRGTRAAHLRQAILDQLPVTDERPPGG
jgi:hypothetical protein